MGTTEQAEWDQRYSGPDLVWGAGPNRFVAGELAALPPGRAIDLGSGEGRNAIPRDGYDLVLIAYLQLPSASLAGVFRAAVARVPSARLPHSACTHGAPPPGPGLTTARSSRSACRISGLAAKLMALPAGAEHVTGTADAHRPFRRKDLNQNGRGRLPRPGPSAHSPGGVAPGRAPARSPAAAAWADSKRHIPRE